MGSLYVSDRSNIFFLSNIFQVLWNVYEICCCFHLIWQQIYIRCFFFDIEDNFGKRFQIIRGISFCFVCKKKLERTVCILIVLTNERLALQQETEMHRYYPTSPHLPLCIGVKLYTLLLVDTSRHGRNCTFFS